MQLISFEFPPLLQLLCEEPQKAHGGNSRAQNRQAPALAPTFLQVEEDLLASWQSWHSVVLREPSASAFLHLDISVDFDKEVNTLTR